MEEFYLPNKIEELMNRMSDTEMNDDHKYHTDSWNFINCDMVTAQWVEKYIQPMRKYN